MMVGAVSQYMGAALAVGIFADLGVTGVAWLRVAWSALFLLVWRRPRWDGFDSSQRKELAVFGVALAVMNLAFYLAIDRLPLGTAVAIEFSGPIAVAAWGHRKARGLVVVGLAAAGVVLLADVQWRASPAGVCFALAAAAMWAVYILWGRRIGARGATQGLDGLALATAFGALAVAPVGLAATLGALGLDVPLVRGALGDAAAVQPSASSGLAVLAAVGICAAVALCSNVVPYALDQVVLARIPAAQFALLSTLLPVTAVAVGVVALAQRPTLREALGIGLVVAALALRPRPEPRRIDLDST